MSSVGTLRGPTPAEEVTPLSPERGVKEDGTRVSSAADGEKHRRRGECWRGLFEVAVEDALRMDRTVSHKRRPAWRTVTVALSALPRRFVTPFDDAYPQVSHSVRPLPTANDRRHPRDEQGWNCPEMVVLGG